MENARGVHTEEPATVLVTGGAGYIGSHAIQMIRRTGLRVVTVDSLVRGDARRIPSDVPFLRANVCDTPALSDFMQAQGVTHVMHFAGLAYVDESVRDPLSYYETNAVGMLRVLCAMSTAGVRRLIFSSTCAVYSPAVEMPVTEQTAVAPNSPYGRSKLLAEQIIRDTAQVTPGFQATILRYFNVAGCSNPLFVAPPDDPRLIPRVIQAMQCQLPVPVYGVDYATPDGSCVRDYIHVDDLCEAHVLAVSPLSRPVQGVDVYNLGTGIGYSVLEIARAVGNILNCELTCATHPRRPGDAPQMVAAADKARRELGWTPTRSDLPTIVNGWVKAQA